ncbi:hypothetical protein, partial [Stenotrophomonas sp. SPM]|uniref:hypothetical protein n=1 Tax=Stenotrophomonas sp. SPM TaxID=2170735 RepID=UPI001057E0BD
MACIYQRTAPLVAPGHARRSACDARKQKRGIRTLSRSGYDVDAMAGFFERMSAAMRGNDGG